MGPVSTLLCAVVPCAHPAGMATAGASEPARVLAFSKTAGFRHGAQIEAGLLALEQIGAENGFALDATEDASVFEAATLARYAAVIFFFTSGDVLDVQQQAAFEAFVAGGGGFVGVHSASDTEFGWPFYGELVGAYFSDHPATQTATVQVVDGDHASISHLPASFEHFDEWYNFDRNPVENPDIRILLAVDETSYSGGTMGAPHPVAWLQELARGRSWYTALGHTFLSESDYLESFFGQHLLGGIQYAAALPEPGARTASVATFLAVWLLRARERARRRERASRESARARE
jgi:cytochrome c